ncbi:hypothetical protein JH06_4873 [Blastocystis sp. subtype 4]|uniref:hypothetical protein n=1 Tax=Blastocystis sp. subtype 4 TaxID=944170 RepID=UPI0007115AB3|nr:hypothetical protein JH06_4873 [Blastocystis sp. subtype 4]KNB41648.1 hypothetical protein JH06_4873 [Blastocystis sp. subtype 4]|eukprot:XP_014525091.1 hypothetical protein JH06_4873 [Blastocystis sp. subtype 4]
MSNINITSGSSYLEFLGDYEIESVEMTSGDELNGEAVMKVLIDGEGYEMRVSIKEGKKEGVGLIVRKNGTLFMRMMFVNDECEGEVIKKSKFGKTVLKGTLEKGKEVGLFVEYDEDEKEVWRGFYRNGERYSAIKKCLRKSGFYEETSVSGELLRVSQYDDRWKRHGTCFEFKDGKIAGEYVYEHGKKDRTVREFHDDDMRMFDKYGRIVYEGIYFGDIYDGFCVHPKKKGMPGFFKEMNKKGDLLSISQYDDMVMKKEGKCFEFERGRIVRECEYKNNECIRVYREWKEEVMIEYNENGMRVYEGGFGGDMMKGYKRDKEGTEYDSDGTALYVGHYVDGERSGYGTEYKGCYAWYIGNWKNGKRSGKGKEYDENEHVVKDGEWIDGRWEEDVKLEKLKEKYREMELKQKKMKESNRGIIFLIIGAVLSL